MKKIIFFFVVLLFVSSIGFAEEGVQEFSIIAKQWEFFPNTITVEKGVPVKVYITTIDVPHGFKLSEFKAPNLKLKKGEITTLTFTPTKVGSFTFACSVLCGKGHGRMKGQIIVEE